MNNLVKFCEWAKENGHGKIQIPIKVMEVFTEYLDDQESKVNKLNKADVIKSAFKCDDVELQPIECEKWRGCFDCPHYKAVLTIMP